jgi:hypothetical protein
MTQRRTTPDATAAYTPVSPSATAIVAHAAMAEGEGELPGQTHQD